MGNCLANSSSIFVFPTTKREQINRSSRLLTEKNLVDIVNRLVDVESFVINRYFTYGNKNSLEFNIYGYYISVDNFDEIIDSVTLGETITKGSSIWANIFIYKTGDYEELYGADENGAYSGVVFTFNEPIQSVGGGKVKKLKLVEFLNNSVSSAYIPQSSLIKFSVERFMDPIDCGEIY